MFLFILERIDAAMEKKEKKKDFKKTSVKRKGTNEKRQKEN